VAKMGKLNLKIKDDIDQRFRTTVFKRMGLKKGNLTKAVEEAMLLWINAVEKTGEKQRKT
jgi:hypothetical protein